MHVLIRQGVFKWNQVKLIQSHNYCLQTVCRLVYPPADNLFIRSKCKAIFAFSESYIPLSIISCRDSYNIGMRRKKPLINHLVLLVLFAIVLEACTVDPQLAGMLTEDELEFQQRTVVVDSLSSPENTEEQTVEPASGWRVEIIAEGLYIPWSVVFLQWIAF